AINLGGGRIPHIEIVSNHIDGFATLPFYTSVDVPAGDIRLIRGAGPFEPWDAIRATFGSTWAETSQGEFYQAIVVGYDGTDEVWSAISYGTAAPVAGTHRLGDRVINWVANGYGAPMAWRCVDGGTPGEWASEGPLPGLQTATTAELENSAHAINTVGKYIGKQVWNSTTAKPVFAVEVGATSVWNDAVGALAHTPIP
nr:hypothetical protein [Dehalococcoidia bacterium]